MCRVPFWVSEVGFLPTSIHIRDRNTAGVNAFSVSLASEKRQYINTTWVVISQVLQKLIAEKVTAMIVIPSWRNAPWYELYETLCVKAVEVNDVVYLDNAGNLIPKPWYCRWVTSVSSVL